MTNTFGGAGDWGIDSQSSSSAGSSGFSFKGGGVELQDPLWHSDLRESDDDLMARAERFLQWAFWFRHESSLAVVSHHGLIAAMLRVLGVE